MNDYQRAIQDAEHACLDALTTNDTDAYQQALTQLDQAWTAYITAAPWLIGNKEGA